MLPSSAPARALSRSRAATVTAALLLLTLLAGVAATVALAIPPGGPVENRPAGWTATLDRKVVPSADAAYAGGTNAGMVTFTVTGAPEGTVLNAKIDDGLVKPAVADPQDVVKKVTVPAPVGGNPTTASATIDLSADVLAADRDALRTGRHDVRLVGTGYSFRLDFVVRPDKAPGGAVGGSPTRTAVVGPPADQPVAWANLSGPYTFFPQLQVGSLIPYRATGFDPGQTVALKVDDSLVSPAPPVPTDTTIWALLTADQSGVVSGVLDYPSVTSAAAQGSHWLRFLTGVYGGTAGSQYAPFAVKAATSARALDVAASAQRGRQLAFSGTGFVREPADYTPVVPAGQTLTARVDGIGPAVDVTAGADGIVSGAVPLPADTALGTHQLVVFQGFRKESDYPEAVYRRPFEVTAFVPDPVAPATAATTPAIATTPAPAATTPAAPTTPKPRAATVSSSSLKASRAGRIALSLVRPSVATTATISVTSKSRLKVDGARRKKVVTLVKAVSVSLKAGTAKQRNPVSLRLTKDGRTLVKRLKTITVVVRVAPKGGKALTRTLKLRG